MKLRISSSLNLHSYPMEVISEYIRQGLLFHKKAGFDAADFPSALFKLMGENWEKYLAIALKDAAEIGIRIRPPFRWQILTDRRIMMPLWHI